MLATYSRRRFLAFTAAGAVLSALNFRSVYAQDYLMLPAILDKWRELGGETGLLGRSTTGTLPTYGGYYTEFERGMILWSESTGAHELHGAIWGKFIEKARYPDWTYATEPTGIGFPINDESICADQIGRFNHFNNGGAIYWHPDPAIGAHYVPPRIVEQWAAANWENGRYGFPLAEAVDNGGYPYQQFQGDIIRTYPPGPLPSLE